MALLAGCGGDAPSPPASAPEAPPPPGAEPGADNLGPGAAARGSSAADPCGPVSEVSVRAGTSTVSRGLRVSAGALSEDLLDDGFDVHVQLTFRHEGQPGGEPVVRTPSLLSLPQPTREHLLGYCVRVVRVRGDTIELEVSEERGHRAAHSVESDALPEPTPEPSRPEPSRREHRQDAVSGPDPTAADESGPGRTDVGASRSVVDAVSAHLPAVEPEEVTVLATQDYGRRTYALLSTPVIDPDGNVSELVDIWLAALDRQAGDNDTAFYRLRRGALSRLYGSATASTEGAREATEAECSMQTSIRVRDLDGDGELEITAIVAFLRPQPNDDWLHGGAPPEECGAVAFIVGDDFEVQASFTREYGASDFAASETAWQTVHTTWRVQDLNHDGHADLVVVERWRYRFNFEGDYVGAGESAPAARERLEDRRELECLWTEAVDRWICPDGVTPGQYLFGEPAARTHGRRPW